MIMYWIGKITTNYVPVPIIKRVLKNLFFAVHRENEVTKNHEISQFSPNTVINFIFGLTFPLIHSLFTISGSNFYLLFIRPVLDKIISDNSINQIGFV